MAIITLTTDFGLKDHFVGAVKGSLYRELPEVKIVDISHTISPFNIYESAYILKNAYGAFPKGSIHVVGVDYERSPENQHIAVALDGHYFIGANNGIIGFVASEIAPSKVVEIDLRNTTPAQFPIMGSFLQVAAHLVRGGSLDLVGKPFTSLLEPKEFMPQVTNSGNTLVGNVIYIDNYGNVVTNIRKEFFDAYRKGRNYEVTARYKRLTKIHQNYNDIIDYNLEPNQRRMPGEFLAIFNSTGHLELAIYKSNLQTVGGASTLMGLDYRDTITINFL